MSTVALDRQHRWRCRLQDFGPHLQPPTPLSQPSKPTPSFPPSHLHPPSPPCFPVNVSPLQNPATFKICLFPSAGTPVFGVSRSLVPHPSAVPQKFHQGDDLNRSSPSPFAPPPPLHFNSPQTCNCHSFPTPSYTLTPTQPPDTPKSIRSSQENQVISQDSQSCSNVQVTQAGTSSTNSCMTACNMHAQAASDNLAVTSIERTTLTHRKCSSEGLFLEVNKMCIWHDLESSSCNGSVTTAPKFSEIDSPAVTSTSSSSYSTSPLVKTANSSSVPKSLESYTCFKDVTTTALSLAANRQSNNNYVSFYASSSILGLKNSSSKSDSNLCHIRSSIKTDLIELPREGQFLKTKCLKPKECVLSTKERGESLTTEEDSSSFDSGQEESLESLKRDPSHKSRKKRIGTHNQQDESHTSREKSLNVSEYDEENITSHEESSHECRIGVPYNNNNSRGSISGKSKGSACCPRRRLIDDEGYIRRAACLCVNKEETQVLLVSSKKDRCAWLVPGGGLEVGEDAAAAATREAWEEAGVLGHINRYLGLFESYHHSGQKKHRTAVYVLTVTEEHNNFPEARLGRRRQWFSTEEALLHLTHHRPLQSAYIQLMIMSKQNETGAS